MNSDRKQIAIIEIYSHHVFVHTLASSLLASGHNVTVYVSERIFKDLEPMFLDTNENLKFCVFEGSVFEGCMCDVGRVRFF